MSEIIEREACGGYAATEPCSIHECKLIASYVCRDSKSYAMVLLCQRHADIIAPALRKYRRGALRPIAGTIIAALLAGIIVGLLFAIAPVERLMTTHPTFAEWWGGL